jgi:PAS domain S-box-containing protein
MRAFGDLSIRQKLTRVAVLASSIALLSAALAFVVYDVVTYRASLVRRLATDADIIAANSVSAILFEDEPAAGATLSALRVEPHVIAAAIYDAGGRLFATYTRAPGTPPPDLVGSGASGHIFRNDRLVLFRSIRFEGRAIGTVVITSDLTEIFYRLWRYLGIVAVVSLLSFLLSVTLSRRLQSAISRPVLRLAEAARQVSRDRNFESRVAVESGDEVGELTTTFNEMLAAIRQRDAELQEIRSDLERRVEARTHELARELAERERAEADLRKSEMILAEAQRLAHIGSWEWDVATSTVLWSDEVYRMMGVEAKTFQPTYERFLELVHPEDRESLHRSLRDVLQSSSSTWTREYRVRRPDGARLWAESHANVVRDGGGRPLRLVGAIQDITERKAAEEERAELAREQAARAEAEGERRRSTFLSEVQVRLAALLDDRTILARLADIAVPDIADWCVVYARLDHDRAEVVGLRHRDPEKQDALAELVRRAPLDPANPGGALDVMRAGEARLLPVMPAWRQFQDPAVAALRDAAGFTSGMLVPLKARDRTLGVVILASVGDRHFGFKDLALAQSLADRGALMADNARLYREAQEANRMKDEFLATLSHELRTPLNAIVGWTKLLQGGQLDEPTTRRAIDTIDRNARAQTQLIEDILDVSRIVAGKLQLNVRETDLKTVVEGALDSVRHAAEAKGVRLEARLAQSVPLAGDPDRLQQVVWNLLSNAIKFTPREGWVRVTVEPDDAEAARVVVEDRGMGIRREFLPHVFERFRQADSSSTRPHGGLGLGLAIVRHLVELHGGTVEVTSEGEGRGSRFVVRLPARRAGTAPAPAGDAPPSETSDSGQLSGLDVLLVEDEADARDLLRTMLEQLGAKVTSVASAREALAAFDRRPPDVLLSDIEMPGTDGYTLIREVRARPVERGGSVPSAALTAYARPEDRAAALKAGFQLHLAKPVQPGDLAEAVSRLAGRSQV